MNAMILAAGLGTRLRPYTLIRPKPLFPVLGRPLLKLIIARLRAAGCDRIVVNAHHLREQFGPLLADEPDVVVQHEAAVLGTGGGLRRALESFGTEPVLVVNGDIYHTIDLSEVYRCHCAGGRGVTMVLHDQPRFNTVRVNEVDEVRGFDRPDLQGAAPAPASGERRLAYTGIQVIDPELLRAVTPDTPSCIIDCYRRFLGRGGTIGGQVAEGCFWTDMGTPADYLELHGGLLTGRIPAWPEIAGAAGAGPFHLPASAAVGERVELRDWVCLGDHVRVGDQAVLQRVVAWDGANIAPGTRLTDTIVTGARRA